VSDNFVKGLEEKVKVLFKPADLIIKNGNLVNVYSKKIYNINVAIKGDKIIYVGDDIDGLIDKETVVMDANGKYLCPGLIETHVHTYESHMPISEYAKAVMPHGTTAMVTDFYGEGVVGGIRAIRFFLDLSKKTPLKVFFVLPMPGYYQNQPFGHTGNITEKELYEMLEWPECHGLNEAFVSEVLKGDPAMLELIKRVKEKGKIIYGHASEITGPKLQAWVNIVGRVVDHEATQTKEAFEKHQLGIWLSAREGSACSDEATIMKAITEYGANPEYFMFCTDIASPIQLAKFGHIDNNIRVAIRNGIDPIVAIQMATINAAKYMRVDEYIGSIAPGKFADVLLVDELENFKVSTVIANGQIVAQNGKFVATFPNVQYPEYMFNTVKIPHPLRPEDFKIYVSTRNKKVRVRVIGVKDGTVITDELEEEMVVQNGELLPDIERDILKIVAIERHLNSGQIGKGFVKGFGLKRGAIGTTYSSQRQDMIIVGTNDNDISFAANKLREIGGGFIVVDSCKILAILELPLLGLLSNEPFEVIIKKLENVYKAARQLGCQLEHPFHNLAFTGLPISIGNLKITYQGLVRVWEERVVSLLVENGRGIS
jgi:adenine deaminase